tara:strand:- start:57 stop:275 length:219 start_codon:yes stop_codon:yes gene_type:complete
MEMEKQKVMANAFTSITGIYASYCESCKFWIVHCPECNHNWCGGCCECGYTDLLNKKQAQLDEMLSTLEEKK